GWHRQSPLNTPWATPQQCAPGDQRADEPIREYAPLCLAKDSSWGGVEEVGRGSPPPLRCHAQRKASSLVVFEHAATGFRTPCARYGCLGGRRAAFRGRLRE